jgi:hypothetical protein
VDEFRAPPCARPECALPGRFVFGITDGATQTWCIDHAEDGLIYMGGLVAGIREAIGRV